MDKNQIIIRKIKGYAEQSLEFLPELIENLKSM